MNRTPTLGEVADALLLAEPVPVLVKKGWADWRLGGPILLTPCENGENRAKGYLMADVVTHPWPDKPGDELSPDLAAANDARENVTDAPFAHLGPFVHEDGLARAARHAWAWKGARRMPAAHTAFVRVRACYVLGAGPDAPMIPPGYDPAEELLKITDLCGALLTLRGALCYYNPNGESLRSTALLEETLQYHRVGGPLPLDLWSNIRWRPVSQTDTPQWAVMDTVGMAQLGLPDLEAVVSMEKHPPQEVERFLRNISLRLLENPAHSLRNGDTTTGPGNIRWQAYWRKTPVEAPARPRLLRWVPLGLPRPPSGLRR